jgi:predicted transcriptional regulator
MYIDILNVLINREPLKTAHIMHKTKVNSKKFKEYLAFLIKQGLVEERSVKEGKIVYVITP